MMKDDLDMLDCRVATLLYYHQYRSETDPQKFVLAFAPDPSALVVLARSMARSLNGGI